MRGARWDSEGGHDPAIAAWARDLGLPETATLDEVLDALAEYARRHGLVDRWSRTVWHATGGGPHDPADRMTNAELDELRPRRRTQMRTEEHVDADVTVSTGKRRGGGSGLPLKATMNAYKALAAAHPEEWDTLRRVHRLELGLPEEPAAATKKPSRLDVLREQLRELGVAPKV